MTAERTPVPRMSADDRRTQVLEAATRAFGRRGYAGTTTDAVAKEAGVSQPYVVRMFGTKHDLFLEVFRGATDRIKESFQRVVDAGFDAGDEKAWERIGTAYTDLLADHDFLQVMLHGFAAGSDPEIGAQARRGMGEIYAIIRGTGCDAEQATAFIAHGMLLNVLMAMQAPEHTDEGADLAELTLQAFGADGVARVCGTDPAARDPARRH